MADAAFGANDPVSPSLEDEGNKTRVHVAALPSATGSHDPVRHLAVHRDSPIRSTGDEVDDVAQHDDVQDVEIEHDGFEDDVEDYDDDRGNDGEMKTSTESSSFPNPSSSSKGAWPKKHGKFGREYTWSGIGHPNDESVVSRPMESQSPILLTAACFCAGLGRHRKPHRHCYDG